MFPGTVERLFTQGHEHAERSEYEQAAEAFREALQYEEADEHTLSVFAYSLYEIRQFEEARGVTEGLLASGPSRYIEIMELYLSICMELRDFNHVQQLVKSLLEENVVPEPSIEKFQSILNLSVKLAQISNPEEETVTEIDAEAFELEIFQQYPLYIQLNKLQMLMSANIRPLMQHIKMIVEEPTIHPMIQSLALYVLVEQQVDLEVTIEKFNHTMQVNTKDLALPDEMPIAAEVLQAIPEKLEKEGNVLEMVQYLVTRHILVTYPFQWFDCNSAEVITGYTDYVHSLFGQEIEADSELIDLIQQLEKFSDLPEV